MPNNSPPTLHFDPCQPRPLNTRPPAHLERMIDRRWWQWQNSVWLHVLRSCPHDAAAEAAETARLRQRHSQHILIMMRAGISIATIRRHRLDDPRLTDEVRGILVDAARERQSKAWFRRSEEQRKQDRQRMLIQLGAFVENAATTAPTNDSPERSPATKAVDPLSLPGAIQSIRQHVCEHFYLRETRDAELTARTHRRAHVLPRQIAMYIARQLTTATLEEIGRQFLRHHTTVLYAVNKIERMRRLDEELNGAISRLMNALLP